MIFMADDGKKFKSMDECQEYEDHLNSLKKNKEKRLKELNAAYDKYLSLANAYRKDYDEDPHLDWESFFSRIFV